MPRACLSAVAVVVAVGVASVAAPAQQTPGQRPGAQAAAKPAAPAAKDAQPKDAPAADPGLQRRVEQLEEQLVDMQVIIGTLESLAKGTAGARAAGPMPGSGAALSAADTARLDALETQIRAMAAQLDNLQDQVRSLSDRTGAAPAPAFGSVTVAPEARKAPEVRKEAKESKDDVLDRVFPPPPAGPAPRTALAAPADEPADSEAPPQQLYERAYGYLLQKDYGTAEQTFEEFLKRNPTHHLAGNAQYWLGETFYVRGQYRPAAAAFLKGYQEYAKSQKAGECLLKLAMSLQRLGQKDAACSSYSEFATKFPNPPAHIKSLAVAERKRSGC
jgi:tol-pal system protein YbgF